MIDIYSNPYIRQLFKKKTKKKHDINVQLFFRLHQMLQINYHSIGLRKSYIYHRTQTKIFFPK